MLPTSAAKIQLLAISAVAGRLPMLDAGLPPVAGVGDRVTGLQPGSVSRRIDDDVIATAAPVDATPPISTPIRQSVSGAEGQPRDFRIGVLFM